jgi:methanethiol S-methyltransferase
MWLASFFIILGTMLLYGGVHSILAAVRVKDGIKQHFPSLFRYYRLVYSLFAVFSLLPVFYLVWILPGRNLYIIKSPWVFLTLALQVLSGITLLAGTMQTDNWSFLGLRQALARDNKPEKLTTIGLYQYVRHPIYSLGLFMGWLIPVKTTNLLALLVGITIYTLIGATLEEKKLVEAFPEYQQYKELVPAYLPKLFR